MKTNKGYVYCLNKQSKKIFFVAKFEAIGDSAIFCNLMNENLKKYSANPVVYYFCTAKKDDFSLFKDLLKAYCLA